jgi:hypothetical protein
MRSISRVLVRVRHSYTLIYDKIVNYYSIIISINNYYMKSTSILTVPLQDLHQQQLKQRIRAKSFINNKEYIWKICATRSLSPFTAVRSSSINIVCKLNLKSMNN